MYLEWNTENYNAHIMKCLFISKALWCIKIHVIMLFGGFEAEQLLFINLYICK